MDIDTLIRESDPAMFAPTPDANSVAADRLYDRIVHTPAAPRSSATRPRRRAFAFMAATAVTVGVVISISASGTSPQAAAAEVLRAAATKAATHAPLPPLGPGQYYYDKTVGTVRCNPFFAAHGRGPDVIYFTSETQEIWTARDGSGLFRGPATVGRFRSEHDREVWEATGEENLCAHPAQTITIPRSSADDPGVSLLPSDPNTLGALIAGGRVDDGGRVLAADGHCPSKNGDSPQVYAPHAVCDVAAQFDIVNNLLEAPGAPAKLGPVLYQVLAQLPGVKIVGSRTDAIGRTGTAIQDPSSGEIVVLDENTGTLLETEDVIRGTVTSSTTFVTTAVVDAIGVRPR